MDAIEFFRSLVGLDISEAKKKLGYWWVCEACQTNPPLAWYHFYRAAGGQVVLHTENNIVKSQLHNRMALVYQERDLKH